MGQNVAATVLDGNYGTSVDSRLVRIATFSIAIGSENPRLRFWHWFRFSGGDRGEVQIKPDGGDWETISPSYTGLSSRVWSRPSIDLTSYAGQTVQIAFRFVSDGSGFSLSNGWYIDEVTEVTGPFHINDSDNPTQVAWESGLGDWYVDKGTWEVGTPTVGPDACHEGSNCAATRLDGNYEASIDSRLISPYLTVAPANENPFFRFWHWFSFSGGDQGEVQIKPEGGDWETISGPFTGTSSGTWTRPFVDLTSYAGQTVQIAFRFVSDGSGFSLSNGWYIDEVFGQPPLPVELVSFNAARNGDAVLLQWQTASETNNAGFDVEHRVEDADWRQVTFIEGAGTTTEPQRYTHRVRDLAPGTHHFRLKQIDVDGAFEYSPEVEVVMSIAEAYQLSAVYPNPSTSPAQFTLTVREPQDVRIEVYNVIGQRVATLHDGPLEAATAHRFALDGRALTSGTYLVRATGETFTATRRATLVR